MMACVFVGCRRVDSSGYAGRIFDHLTHRFDVSEVFMDIDAIKLGEALVGVIEEWGWRRNFNWKA
jgi:hypothetical protein